MGKSIVDFKHILLVVVIAIAQLTYSQTKEVQIQTIREQFKIINADSAYQVRTIFGDDIEIPSCNGADLKGYYQGDQLKRANLFVGKSNGIYFTEYYYWNNVLFFVYEVEETFYYDVENDAFNYDSISNLYEGRYYFAENELIKTKYKGTAFNSEVEQDSIVGPKLIDQSKEYAEHLEHAKVKSKAYDVMLMDLLDHSVSEILVTEINPDDSSIIYLDAREYDEFKVSHIKGAIWVGYDDFDINRLDTIAKSDNIIVYCSVGYRSEKVSEKLLKANYANVSNMYGSIFEWVNQGRPVYDIDGNETPNVHAFDKEWGRWLKEGTKVYN
ncbi:MAG: rhodanese-related sulfurtransferase [Crocinitomix sp.]|jgi:rhodanese-related sulfurtransferase